MLINLEGLGFWKFWVSGFLSFGFGWFRSLGPRELVSPSHSSKNILGIGRPFGLPKSGPETPPRLSHQAT